MTIELVSKSICLPAKLRHQAKKVRIKKIASYFECNHKRQVATTWASGSKAFYATI